MRASPNLRALIGRLAGAACLALVPVCARSAYAQAPQREMWARWTDGRLAVRSAGYEVSIWPERGGKIASLSFGGAEATAVDEDGRGGLLEEVHSADLPYALVERRSTPEAVAVTLVGDAGDLRVVRRYSFPADRPWFLLELTFENRSPYRLAGASAPALRSLVVPRRPEDAARQLYCLERGRGAEALPPARFLEQVGSGEPGHVRWMAAADPAARRVVGLAPLQGHCRPLAPRRAAGGGMSVGWAYGPIPPGHKLTASVLVVAIEGLPAVSEINRHFVADSLPSGATAPLTARIELMALEESLREVSLITRAYGPQGEELGPCDPVLFGALAPLQVQAGRTLWSGGGEPALLLHELYSAGRMLGRFAVPVGQPPDGPVAALELPPAAPREPVPGYAPPAPGSAIAPTPAGREKGFLLWQEDGAPAEDELRRLDLVLARDEARTAFLGLRALRPIRRLRFAIGAGSQEAEGQTMPPAALYLWQVGRPPDEPGLMRPLTDLSLEEGEVAYLALTADARHLSPGRYAALLVADADGAVSHVPLSADVLRAGPAPAEDFALWHLPEAAGLDLSGPQGEKLQRYGVSAVDLPASLLHAPAAARDAGAEAAARRLTFLSLSGGGAMPPPAAFPGRPILPLPDPVYLLRAGATTPEVVALARSLGYVPALRCDALSEAGDAPWLLVEDGVEPGLAPRMVREGALTGAETVWLHLDLREADWRRAAIEVRSAFWAAAYQGLAGAAVLCPTPPREADRQMALWHVLRDARSDVAIWRAARRMPASEADAAGLRRLAAVETLVGPDPNCLLTLQPLRRTSRRLYRVAPADGERRLRLGQFETARRRLLAMAPEAPPAPQPAGQLYWRGVPLLEDGRLQWAIVAADGEAAWKQAMALQKAIRAEAGVDVPVRRAFPAGGELPALVWLIGGEADLAGWPDAVRDAVRRQVGAPLVVVELDGTCVAALRGEFDQGALARTLRRRARLYPPARRMR